MEIFQKKMLFDLLDTKKHQYFLGVLLLITVSVEAGECGFIIDYRKYSAAMILSYYIMYHR